VTKAIYAAIQAITADLGGIEKSGKGPASQGGYAFVPVAEIVRALNPLLAKHGVILRERVLDVTIVTDEAMKATPTGEIIHDGRVPTIRVKALAQIEWTWISTDDDSELVIVNYGEAHDVADKATRKANTAAYKEMLLRTFAIVEGADDPDASDPSADAEAVVDARERRSRGEQKIERARPSAGRTTARRETPKVPDPEPEPVAPEPQVATPEPERTPTITQAAAEQRDDTWKPDPEDVAYAEKASTPATAPEPRTQNISALKNDLRRSWTARGMSRDDVNALGRKLTGKEPTEFLFNIPDLERIKKAVEAGEIA
jgi:hypothetical protein